MKLLFLIIITFNLFFIKIIYIFLSIFKIIKQIRKIKYYKKIIEFNIILYFFGILSRIFILIKIKSPKLI